MGAITKATAEAPCPLFTGRGLELRGFTIKMPYKEYLSCHPDNIDSENGILGIYNYDLADRVYNDSSDAIAFQIYCKTGANIANVTTGKNIHGLDVWVEMDVDDFEVTTNLRNADIRGARIQCQADYGVSGVVMGLYVNSKLRGGSTYLGRYVELTSSYGAITLEVRSETSGTGTVTAGDGTSYGMAGLVLTYKGSNALTGNYHAIALNCPYEGGAISGSSIGMYFFNSVILAGTAFDVGIDFGDSMVVKAINIDGCTMAFDADVTITAATNAFNLNVTSTAAQSTGYNQVMQLTLTHSGDLTGGECHILALDATITGNCPYLYLETYYISTSGDPTLGFVAAISIYLDNLGTGVSEYAAIDIGINQSGGDPSGRFCYIRMRSHSATYMPKTAIMLEGAGGAEALFSWDTAANMVEAHSSGSLTYSVKCRIGATDYYLKLYDAA